FTDRVVLVLDGDEAGRKRADEVLENFVSSDVDLRILTLPDDSDPADFLAKHGATELSEQVKSAPDALDHKLDRLTAQIDPRRDSHAVAKAADKMLKILAAAPDGLKIDQILLRMADRLHFDTARLRRRLEHFRQQRTLFSRNKRPAAGPRQYANPPSDPNAAFDIAVQADDAFSGPTGSDGITGSSGTLGPFHAMAPLQTGAPTHAHSPEHFFDPPHAGVPAAPQLTPLRGIDLECFEIIFSDLDLAATSVETIDPEWLDSITAKMLFSALQGLELAGHELSGQAVMTLIENQELKNHLSSVLDRIDSDSSPGDETPQQRYAALMQRFAQRQWRRQQDQVAAQLESAELDETAELEALQRLFEQERQRQLERKT
ncbi:MAG: toprim domain-containing protein, partial [Planctomycetota bacterium]